MIESVAARRSRTTQSVDVQPAHHSSAGVAEASHILIPVTLSANELPAIRLGLQMAAGTQSRVTIVYVGPVPLENTPRNWLDSIDRLHHSLNADRRVDGPTLARFTADQLKTFVDSAGVSSLLAQTEASLITRPGDFCEEILRLAQSQDVDLVVLPGEMLQGWIPVVPSGLRRKLQQFGKRILAVWPEAATHRSNWHQAQTAAFAS